MRSINWSSVEERTEGAFDQLEAGAYVCSIQSVEDVPAKEYARVLVDVADGARRGFFSDAFYADKPWAHSITLSYKDRALPFLKGRLKVIEACNPGFDPFAAWDAGRLDMFCGRKVGVVFRAEEYWDRKAEEFRVGSARPDRLCKLDEVPTIKAPDPKMLDDEGRRAALERAGMSQLEIDRTLDRMEHGAGAAPAAGASDDGPLPFD